MSQQLALAHTTPPEVQTYALIEISNDILCDEPLDAVKCLPEFAGAHELYVSWRQAALTAYRIFRPYDGISRHYYTKVALALAQEVESSHESHAFAASFASSVEEKEYKPNAPTSRSAGKRVKEPTL